MVTDEGSTRYLEEDLRDPAAILGHPQLEEILDLDRPVALMRIAVLHFIPGHEQARSGVHHLLDALPSGSYLAASNFTLDYASPQQAAVARQMIEQGKADAFPRTHQEFGEFFAGLDLVEPGIVAVSEWHPTGPADQLPAREDVAIHAAVGRKP